MSDGAEPAAQRGHGSAATPAGAVAMSLASHDQGLSTNAGEVNRDTKGMRAVCVNQQLERS
jgi:hypothetical protein